MAYHIWKFLVSNPAFYIFLYSLSLHVTQMMKFCNLALSQRGWEGNTIPLAQSPSQWPNPYETK